MTCHRRVTPDSTDSHRATGSISMTTQTTTSSIRALVVALALLLASLFAGGVASASTLVPLRDMGAPGGGGGIATVVDDTANSTIPGIRAF